MILVLKLQKHLLGLPGSPVVKNPPADAGGTEDSGSMIPGSERSPGGGHSNPLQYSCLENPMDKRSLGPTVHERAKSQAQLRE